MSSERARPPANGTCQGIDDGEFDARQTSPPGSTKSFNRGAQSKGKNVTAQPIKPFRRLVNHLKPSPTAAHLSPSQKLPLITFRNSYSPLLLVLVPLGIIAGRFMLWGPMVIFVINLAAFIPNGNSTAVCLQIMSAALPDPYGGILSATSANSLELIVGTVALAKGKTQLVQSMLLGSILSNLLLVMGMCFFLGNIVNMRDRAGQGIEQTFASATIQTTRSLMTLSAASLVIPATLYFGSGFIADRELVESSLLKLSRGTALILLCLYPQYLSFQLLTHPNLFNTEIEYNDADECNSSVTITAATINLFTMVGLTVLCINYLIDSADSFATSTGINSNFIGLIMIPFLCNLSEHIAAVTLAVENKMDLAMGIALGSSIQIALFITPLLVIVGWVILDTPMILGFSIFETIVLVFSVWLTNNTTHDGRSNYLQGAMLLGLYIMIALAFFVIPFGLNHVF